MENWVIEKVLSEKNHCKLSLKKNKAGYTNQLKSRVLGRSGNVEGRGSGESRIHDSISRV